MNINQLSTVITAEGTWQRGAYNATTTIDSCGPTRSQTRILDFTVFYIVNLHASAEGCI